MVITVEKSKSSAKGSDTLVEESARSKVVVIEGHPITRFGLAELLQSCPEFDYCGDAGDVIAGEELIRSARPDLVVLDLFLDGVDGLALIRSWKKEFAPFHILVISAFDERIYAHRVLNKGAKGFLMKSAPLDQFVQAAKKVAAGEVAASSQVLSDMILNGPVPGRMELDKLTDRELAVFHLIGCERSVREVAENLCISPRTVERHQDNIKTKLGLGSNRELRGLAVRIYQGGGGPRRL